MITLVSVYQEQRAIDTLYELLKEREPYQSISHKGMPTFDQHVAFVKSLPYVCWYLVMNEADEYVGSVYLSKQREIGVFIFKAHARKGYGMQAVRTLMSMWPGKHLANISPSNHVSVKLFEKLGAKHIQNTYEITND
jgi:RimJ/RimL family protein N-acetyltransferase